MNFGFDHGVGHPFLLLCNTKAHNYRNNKSLEGLSHYFEWPKVADTVIEAEFWSYILKKARLSEDESEREVPVQLVKT